MDFIKYSDMLGLGFSDSKKTDLLFRKVFSVFESPRAMDARGRILSREYTNFCILTGTKIKDILLGHDYYEPNLSYMFQHCVSVIKSHSDNLKDFLLYYISLVNSVDYESDRCDRKTLVSFLEGALKEAHILYEVLEKDKEFFIFPKGAEELDKGLVLEPLQWLEDYPKAHGTFCRALKQYSDGEHTRDVADNFRKALEEFLQEYLNNDKNLESNRIEVGKDLKAKGLDTKLSEMIGSLINFYKKINDEHSKHNDTLDERLLEFVMYQTGVFIRMLISVK